MRATSQFCCASHGAQQGRIEGKVYKKSETNGEREIQATFGVSKPTSSKEHSGVDPTLNINSDFSHFLKARLLSMKSIFPFAPLKFSLPNERDSSIFF